MSVERDRERHGGHAAPVAPALAVHVGRGLLLAPRVLVVGRLGRLLRRLVPRVWVGAAAIHLRYNADWGLQETLHIKECALNSMRGLQGEIMI